MTLSMALQVLSDYNTNSNYFPHILNAERSPPPMAGRPAGPRPPTMLSAAVITNVTPTKIVQTSHLIFDNLYLLINYNELLFLLFSLIFQCCFIFVVFSACLRRQQAPQEGTQSPLDSSFDGPLCSSSSCGRSFDICLYRDYYFLLC